MEIKGKKVLVFGSGISGVAASKLLCAQGASVVLYDGLWCDVHIGKGKGKIVRVINMPKVSVIIPVYNVESYLSQCLDSIVHQTLQDIEIICIDDGSTDGSYAILQEYASNDNRIRVLQQQNSGAGIARNLGMQAAAGAYLSILDADDFFQPNMLEQAYLQCEKDHADICVFRSDRFDTHTEKYEAIPWTIKQKYLPATVPFAVTDIYSYAFQIFNGWSWDKLYRRDFVQRTSLQFQGLRTTNDAYFVFMANVLAGSITTVDKVLAHHRANTGTSLSVTREQSWDCCWQAVHAIRQELIKRNQFVLVEQSFINWALHFLLWNVHTLQGDSKALLIKAMREQYFAELELSKYSKVYFYNQNEYHEYLQIVKNGKLMPSNQYAVTRVLQHCRDNGVKATIKRILDKLF